MHWLRVTGGLVYLPTTMMIRAIYATVAYSLHSTHCSSVPLSAGSSCATFWQYLNYDMLYIMLCAAVMGSMRVRAAAHVHRVYSMLGSRSKTTLNELSVEPTLRPRPVCNVCMSLVEPHADPHSHLDWCLAASAAPLLLLFYLSGLGPWGTLGRLLRYAPAALLPLFCPSWPWAMEHPG